MKLHRMTPVPNVFFDELMKDLSASALRVYLKIARNTLGWRTAQGEVKSRDWIAHAQFEKMGLSNRSVSSAVDELVHKKLILVTNERHQDVSEPKLRRDCKRVFYALNSLEANQNSSQHATQNHPQHAISVQDQRKTALLHAKTDQKSTQNLLSTKDIFSQKYNANERIPDHIRLAELMQREEQKQLQRTKWH